MDLITYSVLNKKINEIDNSNGSNTEVVQARGSEVSLGARLDKSDEKITQINEKLSSDLETIQNQSSLIIDLKMLGLKEGSENANSNTLILKSLIEQYPKGEKTFYISRGTYHFNPIDLTNIVGGIIVRLKGENNGMSTSWFKGISTIIKTTKQDFIYDKRASSPGITFYVDDIKFYSFDGYNQVPSGVCFGVEKDTGNEYNFHFYNVLIHGFDYGFKSPGFSCAGSGGENITFSTCHYGMYIKKASHLFHARNVELTYNRVGMRFGHGGSPCVVENIHVANGYLGSDRDEFDRFLVIHCKGDVKISNIYQEAYEGSAQPEKTTVIDYEGWAYGVGPVIVENTSISKPSGNGGLFFKGRTFLGAGTEEGVANPITIKSGNLGHYPDGCAKFVNCKIGKVMDITGIFDVPPQSAGYDINGKMFYNNLSIINKNNIGTVNSKWTYTSYNITSVTDNGYTYNIYNHSNLDETYKGFKATDLDSHKEFDGTAKIKLSGNILIENTLSDNLDTVIGFMHKYYINNVVNYKFYPIATLKGLQGVATLPFNFNIERVAGEDYRTSVNIATRFTDEAKKLKSTDFSNIRFSYNIETYRN